MIENLCLDGAKQILAKTLKLKISILEDAFNSLSTDVYKKIEISKKDGSKRVVYFPKNISLRIVQKAILEKILYTFDLDDNFFGFCKGKNIKENALYHVWDKKYRILPRWILKIDIENAFPSVDSSMLAQLYVDIFSWFANENGLIPRKHFYEFVHLILMFTTYNGTLVQGISTSPYLFNLYIYRTIHRDLKNLLEKKSTITHHFGIEYKEYNFQFSWYADDLVISFPRMIKGIKKEVIEIIEQNGFSVNKSKIRLTRVNREHPLITGVVINNEISYSTPYITEIEVLYYLHKTITTRPKSKTIKSIRGKIHRAICIIKSGRLPNKEQDGMTINTVIGYVEFIKYMSRIDNNKQKGMFIPPALKKVITEFEKLIKK